MFEAIAKKIAEIESAPQWFKSSFPQQTAFINSPAKLKLGQCTRRAGKSYGSGLYMVKEAYEHPGVSILYLAPRKEQAKRIMWKDILRSLDTKFKLGAKFNDYDLTMTFPNGSIIYLDGGDSSYNAAEKIRGQKLKLCVVDEAASFINDLESICNKILIPTLADYDGTLALISTTNDFVKSYFARASQGSKGWTLFKWRSSDNPYTKNQIARQIKAHKKANPNVENEPWFRQEYLNEWIVDTRNRLYKYDPDSVPCKQVPADCTYILGVNLSYTGLTGYSVVAFTESSREAYVVETVSYEDPNIYRALETIDRLSSTYGITSVVLADASKKLGDELQNRFAIPVIDTSELDQLALKRVFLSDLDQGLIKVLPENKSLTDEWDSIILDPRPSARKQLREHPLSPSSLATATLYAWSQCYNYNYEKPEKQHDEMVPVWKEIEERLQQERSFDDLEADFFGRY